MVLDGDVRVVRADAEPVGAGVQGERGAEGAPGPHRHGLAQDGPELPGQPAGHLDHGLLLSPACFGWGSVAQLPFGTSARRAVRWRGTYRVRAAGLSPCAACLSRGSSAAR
jgi:hypothetical protein